MINIQVHTDETGFDSKAIAATEDFQSHLTFSLANQTYAVNLKSIREVRKLPPLSRVAHAPSYILGVGSIRGEIVPVVDLKKRFNLCISNDDQPPETSGDHQEQLILVTEIDGKRAAVTVDSISEVEQFSTTQVRAIPKTAMAIDLKYLRGMVQHGGKVLLLIDLEKILEPDELHQLS
jgi:purine-binding chemotaxis protein CheW